MKKLSQAIAEVKFKDRPKNIAHEFQMYGVYLAESLGDTKHYSLYIKLAKQLERQLLEEALNFTKGYYEAKSKAKIFMWKLKQLKKTSEHKFRPSCHSEPKVKNLPSTEDPSLRSG